MDYLLITISALLFSLQFLFNNQFQERNGVSVEGAFQFSFYTSVFGFMLLIFTNGLRFEFSVFSFVVAVVYALINFLLNYCSIKAFRHASLSVYSIFAMIGGLILPFVYGVLCGDEFKLIRLLCCLLILFSILLTLEKGKSVKAFRYYLAVFFLNGMVGVVSAFHQAQTALCVDSGSFLMMTRVVMMLVSLMYLSVKKSVRIDLPSLGYCAGHSVVNTVGNLLILIALLTLAPSVQYPIVTGGTIIFSVVIDFVRKVKVTKKQIIAAFVSLLASVFMAF